MSCSSDGSLNGNSYGDVAGYQMPQKKVKFNKTNITVKSWQKAKVTLKKCGKKSKGNFGTSPHKKVIELTKKSKKYAVVKGVKKGTTTLKATYKKGKVKKILKCKVKVEKRRSENDSFSGSGNISANTTCNTSNICNARRSLQQSSTDNANNGAYNSTIIDKSCSEMWTVKKSIQLLQ